MGESVLAHASFYVLVLWDNWISSMWTCVSLLFFSEPEQWSPVSVTRRMLNVCDSFLKAAACCRKLWVQSSPRCNTQEQDFPRVVAVSVLGLWVLPAVRGNSFTLDNRTCGEDRHHYSRYKSLLCCFSWPQRVCVCVSVFVGGQTGNSDLSCHVRPK